MGVHNIQGQEQFQEQVVEASKNNLVILDCFATWCGPCKAIAPKLAEWSNQDTYADVKFVKIDVDESSEVAADLGIRAMPTFLFYKGGEKVDELIGAEPKKLVALLNKHK